MTTERQDIIEAAAPITRRELAELYESALHVLKNRYAHVDRGAEELLALLAAELRREPPAREVPIAAIPVITREAAGLEPDPPVLFVHPSLAPVPRVRITRREATPIVLDDSDEAPVPRGHCGRCGYCGEPMHGQPKQHADCWTKGPRSHCAGCGAPYEDKAPRCMHRMPAGVAIASPYCGNPLPCAAHPSSVERHVAAEVALSAGPGTLDQNEWSTGKPPAPADEPPKMPERGPAAGLQSPFESYDSWVRNNDHAISYRVRHFNSALDAAEWHQRDAARWRERAEQQALTIDGLRGVNKDQGGCIAKLVNERDGLDAQLRAERERGEAALPDFVCVFREAARKAACEDRFAMARVLEESKNDPDPGAHAAMQCLSWLATAPAAAVSRLALDGDALQAVREFAQAEETHGSR